jgi:timeless
MECFVTVFNEKNAHSLRSNNYNSVLKEQILLRDNAIEQADLLMEYKQLFVKHPSHHYAFKDLRGVGGGKTSEKGTKAANGMGLMSIFTSLLAEPLSKTGSSRTSADHLTIELVLHLIRNLLSISPINTFGSPEKSQYASQLHRELLIVLQEEMVLDVLVCVGQEVERRENSGYNLLLMEILSCLLRGQV